MTDSTDGAWKSPAKASALWRNKEPGTLSEKYGWKREEGRQRVGEKQGEGWGRRRCYLFNVEKCREDPCLGKFGFGEGLRAEPPAAVYLLLCDVQPRPPDSDYPQTLLSFPFYLWNSNETNEQDSALREGSDCIATRPSGLPRCHSVASFQKCWKQQ